MICKHAYYKKEPSKSRESIFCKITNDYCAFQRFCNKEKRIIQTDGWLKCKMKDKKSAPNGAKRVLFEVDGTLYIELDDKTIKKKNDLGKKVDYVFVREDIDGYTISDIPFEEKKSYARRKSADK